VQQPESSLSLPLLVGFVVIREWVRRRESAADLAKHLVEVFRGPLYLTPQSLHRSIFAFRISQYHADVKNAQQTVRDVFFARCLAFPCPRETIVYAEVGQCTP
jgi:hypothetical protein